MGKLALYHFLSGVLALTAILGIISPTRSETQETETPVIEELDLSPEIRENSPVLQRWQQKIPDLLEDIQNDPAFRTRLRVGYGEFPSSEHRGGWSVGVEDIFIGQTGFTLRGEYQTAFNSDRQLAGGDLQYYVLPFGNYVNIAPLLGYRYLQTDGYATDGVNVGLRLMLPLSRTGAADIAVTQSFVSPGGSNEVGLTRLSVGYALTSHLRLSADIEQQNSPADKDSRVGIFWEWMP
jgi:hypothetical protein